MKLTQISRQQYTKFMSNYKLIYFFAWNLALPYLSLWMLSTWYVQTTISEKSKFENIRYIYKNDQMLQSYIFIHNIV